MRILHPLLLFAAPLAPAAAQAPSAVLAAMARDFPLDHAPIARAIEGKSPAEARRIAYDGIASFFAARSGAILAAPAADLLAIEAQQGALLRSLEKQDVRLCAEVGDAGFFGAPALAGDPPPGLEDYGIALVAAARAGTGAAARAGAEAGDVQAWSAEIKRIEPAIPVLEMIQDPERRKAAAPEHLCRGAAAMHEAVARLPAETADRMARLLLRSVLFARR